MSTNPLLIWALIIILLAFCGFCAVEHVRRVRARGLTPDPADYMAGVAFAVSLGGALVLLGLYIARRVVGLD